MVSSARANNNMSYIKISTEEEDLLHRSHCKENPNGGNNSMIHQQLVHASGHVSYKEKLLNVFGEDVHENLHKCIIEETTRRLQLQTTQEYIDDGPVIPLDDDELDQWAKPWKKTLIVNTLGKRIHYKVLENYLRRNWSKKGNINISDMADGFFSVQFTDEGDYNHALFEGPWRVADHYLIVQRWRPLFSKNADVIRKVAVWIRIPRLPLELYNAQFLWRIGSTLGTMLKIDRLTSIHSRGQYARICVEIDLDKILAPHIVIRGHKFPIEYEGLHLICFVCGKYGHKTNQCSMIIGSNIDDGTKVGCDNNDKVTENNGGKKSDCTSQSERIVEQQEQARNGAEPAAKQYETTTENQVQDSNVSCSNFGP
jgi:hypothetical protein